MCIPWSRRQRFCLRNQAGLGQPHLPTLDAVVHTIVMYNRQQHNRFGCG